jgi:hypothetical protein
MSKNYKLKIFIYFFVFGGILEADKKNRFEFTEVNEKLFFAVERRRFIQKQKITLRMKYHWKVR